MKQVLFNLLLAFFISGGVATAATNTLHDKPLKTPPTSTDETYVWDTGTSTLKKTTFAPFLVGDCTGFPCLDGTSDGGNYIKLWAGTGSYWTALQGGSPAANRSWRLPIAAPPAAGATYIMNMDEYGQMGFVDPDTLGGGATAIDDLTDVDTTGKATGKILKFNASGNLIVGDDSTGSGSIPSGTINGQVLIWAADQWVASTAPWLTTALLSAENTWTAIQNFNAGLTATGLTQNLTSWGDWTFGGTQIVNASGTGDNVLWPASKVISELAGKQDVGGGAGGYVSMSAAPYSDTACTTGQYSYYGSTAYLCTGGFWASKWTLTSHSNPTPDIPVITSATIPAAGNVVNVVFDQSMTDGAALGTWTVDCSTTGLASLTTPTGTGVNRAYPIDTSVIKLGETCLGYYTVPAGNDGITATDDSVDLPSQVGFAIDNQSAVPVGNSALFTAATAVWDFDGNSNDTKGVYNLTPNGTITYSTSEKLQGTSSATMGATSYLTYPSDGAFDPGVTGDWSYSAKVKDSNYYSCPLWFRYYSGNGIRDIGTVNSTTDKFYFRQYASSVGSTVTGETLTDNTWTTITITYKHADAKLYVWISSSTFGDITNGAAYDVTNGAGDATGMLYIGSQGSTTGLITGQLDEVVWWKGYSVTATDAQNIFNGTWR